MMKLNFDVTERIIHHLMLSACFIPDIGLFHGQMGITLAMSEYSRDKESDIYFDVAPYLLDNIMENIHKNLTCSFDAGLSGIDVM